jgi:S-formylglutathione hydrolase FrmB
VLLGFARWVAVGVCTLAVAAPASASFDLFRGSVTRAADRVNRQIAGRLLDFTRNHGCDRRLYSPALGQRRDLYVYLPPGYDGQTPFPAVLWLHGIGQDEQHFLRLIVVLDEAIRSGAMPPVVIASPDGSIRGRPALFNNGSFYVNSAAGRFEDYVVEDVWGFVRRNFAVRPERAAHLIAGVSMGGFGAFNLAFKHPDEFGSVAGIMPPLNLRYADCHGRYFANYDPSCVMLRDHLRRSEVIGRFYGVLAVRSRRLLDPLVGSRRAEAARFVAAENPIEMLHTYNIQPGEFNMFIGYGTRDEFNIDAQAEHFADVARRRGIRPEVVAIRGGSHSLRTGLALMPMFNQWITRHLGPYAPPGYSLGGWTPSAQPLCATRPAPACRGLDYFCMIGR